MCDLEGDVDEFMGPTYGGYSRCSKLREAVEKRLQEFEAREDVLRAMQFLMESPSKKSDENT